MAAQIIVDSVRARKDISKAEIVRQAGYSKQQEKSPTNVLASEGVKIALAELGFTLDRADETVASILTGKRTKDETKLKAADIIYKRLGGYAPDKSISVSVKGDVKDFEKYREIAGKYEEELLKKLTEDPDEAV